jgi:hypothetical protein
VIVFSNTITPRLQYILDFIGKEINGEPFRVFTNAIDFRNYNGPKINYSNARITGEEFFLRPHAILFENKIQLQTIDCFNVNGNKAFFKTEGDFPFDVFAATFYLLSRYEEYLPHRKDMYGRYAHENSLAFKENFLHLPLVNLWLDELKKNLKEKYSPKESLGTTPSVQHSVFKFIPTYDIDIAYSYKHKGLWRNAGGMLKDIVNGQWSMVNKRWKILRGKDSDPYDAYNWMDKMHEQYQLKPYYFFHVGARTGKYDKNISLSRKAMQQLIQHHFYRYPVGIHPSWSSGDAPGLLGKEIQSLEKISGGNIYSSRQHYIRFELPHTYRRLIDAGIKFEFSMGYGSINGFRASVASSFYWYDLEKETQTQLQLFPFCFMEANSFYEQEFSPRQALEELRHYYRITKSVHGLLITIWHNNFLGTDRKLAGWREVYEKFIQEIYG